MTEPLRPVCRRPASRLALAFTATLALAAPSLATETVRQVLPGAPAAAAPQTLVRVMPPTGDESEVERFCSNIADAARDRRYALQAAELKQLQADIDARTVSIRKPRKISAARFYAELENLVVESDTPARVVVDSRTGTIVIGNEVKISRVAISHGTLTVRITEAPRVVQPEPFSRGETAVEPYTAIDATQPNARVAVLDGPNLETLVSGLNRLGVKPDGIIAILQGIKSAGALQADLVVQ